MSTMPCAAAGFQETPTELHRTNRPRPAGARLLSSVASIVSAFFRVSLENFAAAAGRPNDC